MSTLTTVVDLLALSASLWLGFYVVTRSPRSRVSWLAALTLWALSTIFLHNVQMINVPESGVLPWLRPLVLFASPLWFHLTLSLRPERPQRRMSLIAERLGLLLIYGAAFALSDRTTGPRYPHAIVYVVLLAGLSLFNLWQGRTKTHDKTLRRQFAHLLVATALSGVGGLYLGLVGWLNPDALKLPGEVVLGAGVVLLGYTVVRHSALLQVHSVRRDFIYSALVISLITLFYYLVALILYFGGHVSFLTLILVIAVTISSHALYDGVRVTLDRFFYREQFRQLRANLRALAQEAGGGEALSDQLQAILAALCGALHINKGLIALRQGDGFVIEAAHPSRPVGQSLSAPALSATEIVSLPQTVPAELEALSLLVPLYAGGAQVGALALGPPASGQPYSEADLELLEDLADQIATVIHTWRLQAENAQAINQMVTDFRSRERALQHQVQHMLAERQEADQPILKGVGEKEFVSLVEDGLRRLHDFSYLGEHALAQLQVVGWRLQDRERDFVTHIDRGKALNEIMLQALHKLRPAGTEPARQQVPSREWHPFVILHDAYVLGELNRDIMSRLYVSEGTFNRARRRAVRGVAKALQEMEQDAQRRKT